MITVIISSNNTVRKVKDSPRIHNELCQVPYNPKIPSKIICAPTPNMAADTRSNVMSKNGLDSSMIWRYQWVLNHTYLWHKPKDIITTPSESRYKLTFIVKAFNILKQLRRFIFSAINNFLNLQNKLISQEVQICQFWWVSLKTIFWISNWICWQYPS